MNQSDIALTIAASCSLTALTTAVLKRFLRRVRLLDWPDGIRKTHPRPVPRGGGIALFLTFAVLLLSYGWSGTDSTTRAIALGASIVFAIGLLDDLCALSPRQKLVGQLLAAAVTCAGGLRIGASSEASLWWSMPLTVLWLVASTNAFNLIDGLDGLASGLGVIAASTVCLVAIQYGQWHLAAASGALAAAVLGFLIYNSPPASIFLGDSGSLLIGFLLGVLTIKMAVPLPSLTGYLTGPILLSVPLLDVGVSIARRFLYRQPLFSADRCHVHHMLANRGFGPARSLLFLYSCAAVSALIAWLQCSAALPVAVLSLLSFAVAAIAAVRWLGYAEFQIAWRMLMGFRRELAAEMRAQAWKKQMSRLAGSAGCAAVAPVLNQSQLQNFDPDLLGCECQLHFPIISSEPVILKTASATDPEMAATLIHMLSTTLAGPSSHRSFPSPGVECVSTRAVPHPFVRHSFSEILLFVTAAMLMRTMKLALLVIRMQTLARVIEAARPRRAARTGIPRGQRIAWAVEAAGRRMQASSLCLIKALAAQMMLTLCGCPADLRIGVRRCESGTYMAHAWLERDGEVLVGGPSSETVSYSVLGTGSLHAVAMDV